MSGSLYLAAVDMIPIANDLVISYLSTIFFTIVIKVFIKKDRREYFTMWTSLFYQVLIDRREPKVSA